MYAVLFRKKLTAALSRGMLAIIGCRVFCCPVCCPEIVKINREEWLYSAHANGMNEQTIILPVVLCGCESWLLTLREEHMVRVFRIFEPNRIEVTGEWRTLYYQERNDHTAHRGWCG
jgi:hypothetical protein